MIGQIVLDTIHPRGGGVTRDLGGLTYSIMAMDALMGGDDRMVPMTRVGRDALDEIERGLDGVAHLCRDGFLEDDGPNNRVELRYVDAAKRVERVTGGVGPLAEGDLVDPVRFDGLLVDLVSGREIEPGVLAAFEGRLDRPLDLRVHLDLHSALLDYDERGRHFPRRPEGWEEWLDLCDVLQVNREELGTLRGVGEGEEIFEEGSDLWRSIRDRRVSVLLVTDGEGGSWCWYENEAGRERNAHVPASPVEKVVDPTGSGDVYGAVFFLSWLRGEGVVGSMIRASRLAGHNCARSGTRALNRYLAEREERFGESGGSGGAVAPDDGTLEGRER